MTEQLLPSTTPSTSRTECNYIEKSINAYNYIDLSIHEHNSCPSTSRTTSTSPSTSIADSTSPSSTSASTTATVNYVDISINNHYRLHLSIYDTSCTTTSIATLQLGFARLDLQATLTCSRNTDYVDIPACHGHEACVLQV
eukprot:6492083-Amphidinium_carterae.3